MRTTTPHILVLRARQQEVPVQARPRRRATRPRCAYCHSDLGQRSFDCDGCGTRLHGECKQLLGTCPTLGCTATWTREPSPPRGLNCARCARGFKGGARRRVCVACGLQYHWRCRFRQAACHCSCKEFRSPEPAAVPSPPSRGRRFLGALLKVGGVAALLWIIGFAVASQPEPPLVPTAQPSHIILDCAPPSSQESLMGCARRLQRDNLDHDAADQLAGAGVRGLRAMSNELAIDPWIERVHLHQLAEEIAQEHNLTARERGEFASLWGVRRSDLPDLMRALESRHMNLRVRARRAVRRLGKSAVPFLVRELERSGSPSLSGLLAEVGEPAIPALRESLIKRGETVAAPVLEEIGGPALAVLLDGLQVGDTQVRLACVTALGSMGDEARLALPELRWLSVAARSKHVRAAAIAAQLRIEDARWREDHWPDR